MKFFTTFAALAAVALPFTSATNCQSIVEIASGNDDFSTLVAALVAADLVDALEGDGPFTVFAPTNDAFDDLPNGVLDDLLKPNNQGDLQSILLYHVVAGKIKSRNLVNGSRVRTLEGSKVSIRTKPVKVNSANVIAADIQACNGVIHVIDEVLIPPSPKPKPTPKPMKKPAPKSKPMLDVVGCKPKPDYQCGMCEGDCDNHDDCKHDYYCFKRNKGSYKPVPYCSGGDKDGSRTDYCTKKWW